MKVYCSCKKNLTCCSWLKKQALIVLSVICFISPVYASPDDTIVLIHGFLGLGRTEMSEIKYW